MARGGEGAHDATRMMSPLWKGAACMSTKHSTHARPGLHMQQCSAVLHILTFRYRPLNASYVVFFRFAVQFLCLKRCTVVVQFPMGGGVDCHLATAPQGVAGDHLPWGGTGQGGGVPKKMLPLPRDAKKKASSSCRGGSRGSKKAWSVLCKDDFEQRCIHARCSARIEDKASNWARRGGERERRRTDTRSCRTVLPSRS